MDDRKIDIRSFEDLKVWKYARKIFSFVDIPEVL